MIEIRPSEPSARRGPGSTLLEVTFILPHRPDIVTAAVVGDFNGWSATATPMRRLGDSLQARVRLVAGARYRFKYLVNDERWENDWAAHDYAPNADGGDDSVIDLDRATWERRVTTS